MTQISFHDSNKAVDKLKMLISVKKKWTATITKKLFMMVMQITHQRLWLNKKDTVEETEKSA